jgi:hypothetical protein
MHCVAIGTTRKSRDVRFRAAVRGIADIKRALIRSASIYEYTSLSKTELTTPFRVSPAPLGGRQPAIRGIV